MKNQVVTTKNDFKEMDLEICRAYKSFLNQLNSTQKNALFTSLSSYLYHVEVRSLIQEALPNSNPVGKRLFTKVRAH